MGQGGLLGKGESEGVRGERELESVFLLGVINRFSSFGTEISIYWTSCMDFPVP